MLSFGFAKFFDVRDSEMCIRGFHGLGYEVGFARVGVAPTPHSAFGLELTARIGIFQFSPQGRG